MDERTSLIPHHPKDEQPLLVGLPKTSQKDLEDSLEEIFSPDGRTLKENSFERFAVSIREIEGAVCRKYEGLHESTKKSFVLKEFAETVEVIEELKGWQWLYRIPSLLLTVIIASSCIPLANILEEVLKAHPILAGFPPAVSAAAGCIGIQNTAIVIRAIGLRLIEPSWRVFAKYCGISFGLSIIAAIVEACVALLVVYLERKEDFEWSILFTDVPAVIFLSMIFVGSIAGIMGAGIPMFVTWLSEVIKKRLDPAHWVGPIETVAQEFSATVLTLYIAQVLIANATDASE